MEFLILGPVHVRRAGLDVPVGGPKPRTVLALLLLHANRMVPVHRVIDELWGPNPSHTATNLVHGYVAQLRRAIDATPGSGSRIVTSPPGYLLRVPDDALDLTVFDAYVRRAREARRQQAPERALDLLHEALGLWRGPALSNLITTPMIQAETQRLEERRLVAAEERFDLALSLGRHADVVGELYASVAALPLRERLRGQLMLGLYRSDRQAEALRAYQDLCRLLSDELGVDPSLPLQRLHEAILHNNADLRVPAQTQATGARPDPDISTGTGRQRNQLPRDVGDFTGRRRERAVLAGGLAAGPSRLNLVSISGKAGVGKTALAVHVAHRLCGEFPDGQVFLNLGGLGNRPVSADEALMRILLLLGVGRTDIPRRSEARAEMYRALLGGRHLLVVLDNVADEAQIRPLLPAGTGSAVLITSRKPLAGLEAATRMPLVELGRDESVELLGRVTGMARPEAEPEAAERIVDLCGRLPLAIRIAGAKLAVKTHWSLNEMVDRLTEEKRRLDELQVGDLDVRASFALSYEALDRPTRQVYSTLGLLHTADFPAWVPATMTGLPVPEIRDALERLVDVQLLDVARRDPAGRHRYRLHDLLAVFARELLDQAEGAQPHPVAARAAAEKRVGLSHAVGGWLAVVDSMEARLVAATLPAGAAAVANGTRPFSTVTRASSGPARTDASYPLGWLPSQVGAERISAPDSQAGMWETGWATTAILVALSFELWSHWDDWRMTREAAVIAAHRVGDRLRRGPRPGEFRVTFGRVDPWSDVVAELESGESILEELGEWRWHAAVTVSLGNLYRAQGCYERAAKKLQRGVTLFRGLDHPGWEAAGLFSLGSLHVVQGRLSAAVARYDECAAIFGALDDRLWQAHTMRALGYAYQQHGRYAEAVDVLGRCLPVLAEQDEPMWQTYTLLTLARSEVGLERYEQASANADRCVVAFRRSGDARGQAMALRALSAAEGRRQPETAQACLEQALRVFEEIEDPVEPLTRCVIWPSTTAPWASTTARTAMRDRAGRCSATSSATGREIARG